MNNQERYANANVHRFCPYCGNNVDNSIFCSQCGKKVNDSEQIMNRTFEVSQELNHKDGPYTKENAVEAFQSYETADGKNEKTSQTEPNRIVGFLSAMLGLVGLVLPFYIISSFGSTLNMSIVWAIQNGEMENGVALILWLLGFGLIMIIIGVCINGKGATIIGGLLVIGVWFIFMYSVQNENFGYGVSIQYGAGFYAMLLGGIGGIIAGLMTKEKQQKAKED